MGSFGKNLNYIDLMTFFGVVTKLFNNINIFGGFL